MNPLHLQTVPISYEDPSTISLLMIKAFSKNDKITPKAKSTLKTALKTATLRNVTARMQLSSKFFKNPSGNLSKTSPTLSLKHSKRCVRA